MYKVVLQFVLYLLILPSLLVGQHRWGRDGDFGRSSQDWGRNVGRVTFDRNNDNLGSDLIAPLDLAGDADWIVNGDITKTDADTLTFTNSTTANVYKVLLTVGKRYRVTWSGTSDASAFRLANSTGTGNSIISGFGTADFTATATHLSIGSFDGNHANGNTINITSLVLQEIQA